MKNFSFDSCTGKDVRIIIMDSGFLKGIHCLDYTGVLIEDHKIPKKGSNDHAKQCLDAAALKAPDAQYMLVNVGDENGIIIEDNVISGLEVALTLLPKVILMSFSFENISTKLKELLKQATDAGIIICASVDPVVKNSYPQKMSTIISVDEVSSEVPSNDIYILNDIFYIPSSLYSNSGEKGSSIANAYVAGMIASIAEFSPLVTADSIKSFYQNESDNATIENKVNAYYVLPGQHDIDGLSELITSNYQYYYDDSKELFRSIDNDAIVNRKEIVEVDIICGDDFMNKKPKAIDMFKKANIAYTCYDNFDADLTYLQNESLALKTISIPSICICSYGMNMEKFSLQLQLNRYLKLQNYAAGNISSNPMAHLLGFTYVPYPSNVSYPKYIYHLNDCLYNTSLDKDILLTSVAGDFDRFVNFEHRLGDTSGLFFTAHNPDVIVLCLSNFIQIAELKKVKHFVGNVIGAKLFFYITKYNKEDNYYGPSDYHLLLENNDIEAYSKYIANATKVKTFWGLHKSDHTMFKEILNLFQ